MQQFNKTKTQNHHRDLIKWLKKSIRGYYKDGVYSDPGYGNQYKSMFGIEDVDQLFYNKNDIDDQLASIHQSITMTDPDDEYGLNVMSEFVDQYSDKRCTLNYILIPPGSNHSNANYMYKQLKTHIHNNECEYEIPYINADPRTPYTGNHKCTKLKLNKEDFYNFTRLNSAH